jgi:HEAT repeat protein
MRIFLTCAVVTICILTLHAPPAHAQFGGGFQTRGLENYKRPDGLTPQVLRPKNPREEFSTIGHGVSFANAPHFMPYGLSWVTWWELNRDRHLKTLIHEALEVREPQNHDLSETTNVLIEALSRNSAVSPSAAITLGRMGATDAVPELIRHTQQLNPEPTHIASWLALGLMGGPGRAQFLTRQLPQLNDADTLTAITALGLIDELPPGAADQLLAYVKDKNTFPEIRRMALWALTEHEPEKHRRLLHQITSESIEPYLIMEALEGLGRAGDGRDIPTLTDFAGADAPPKFAAFLAMSLGEFEKTKDGLLGLQETLETIGDQQSKRGPYQNLMTGLRASAIRALGQLDDPTLQNPVAQGLGKIDQPFIQQSILTGEQAQVAFIISLGLIGQEYASRTIGALVDGSAAGERHPFNTGLIPIRKSTRRAPAPRLNLSNQITLRDNYTAIHRCYAAISAGLLIERIDQLTADKRALNALTPEAFGPKDIPTIRTDLIDSLMGPLASTGEASYTRAACALGLGLSGDKKQIPRLVAIMEKCRKQDEAIYAHIALALGMLGDKNLPGRLKDYLGPPKKSLDVPAVIKDGFKKEYTYEQRMSRRAAILGLAALGDQDAAPLLIAQWGKDAWISYEAGRALGMLKVRTPAPELTLLVYQKQNETAAEVAAWSLGDLYDPAFLSRLTRLQRGYANAGSVGPNARLRNWLKNNPNPTSGHAKISHYLHRFGSPIVHRYLNELRLVHRPQITR